MVAAVKITRTDHTAVELRGLAAKSIDASQVRRLLALALILEGQSRQHTAATQSEMDRQILRDWVHRYNTEGVSGLLSIRSSGHPASLTEAQMAELRDSTIKGPDPAMDNVVRWRCVDLREELARRFTVTVTERTIGRWLRGLEMTRLQPRPFHPKKDAGGRRTFKKDFPA
jgi:transposase